MTIIELTDDNAEDYEDFLDDTVMADIGREYHQGLIIENSAGDGVRASVFWELKNVEIEDEDTISEIINLTSSDSEACEEVLKFFDKAGISSGAKRAFVELSDVDDSQAQSLKNCGFDLKKAESRDICVTVDELASLPFIKKKAPEYIKSLSEVTERQFKSGIMASVLHGRYGLLDDLPFLPMRWFDSMVSSCVVTDDKINGLLLIRQIRQGLYRVELMFAMEPDAKMNLLNMIRYSIQAALMNGSANDVVMLRRHSDSSTKLVGNLFPGKKGDTVIRGEKRYG